jgi:hypothetical protein
MTSKHLFIQFTLGAVFGSVIACSPTKFAQSKNESTLCDGVSSCVIEAQSINIVQSFKVGSGKVDILFVNDNSASMSKNQVQLGNRFSGFIQALDAKSIDYRIAITTTDLAKVQQEPLVTFENGSKFLTAADAGRVNLFFNSIVRDETIRCEDVITSAFGTYGVEFPYSPGYSTQYAAACPESDTRGIYTANHVVAANSNSFIRSDANLNIILISNDNVRQGAAMEEKDKASAFVNMMQQGYPTKQWAFNSIVVKDSTCQQAQTLKTASGAIVMKKIDQYGNIAPAIAGGLGLEYANLSNSAARDVDNNPRPRGKILDICESSYTSHFANIATQISDESRMFTLKCAPSVAPVITPSNVPHTWSGDKVVFGRGSEGISVSIKYSCYTGPT